MSDRLPEGWVETTLGKIRLDLARRIRKPVRRIERVAVSPVVASGADRWPSVACACQAGLVLSAWDTRSLALRASRIAARLKNVRLSI